MLKKIAETMAKAGSIAILPHIAADGDAIGSSLALAIGLSGTGKDVRVLLEEKVPQIYSFLPGLELAGLFDADDRRYDLAVALDCGDLERLGSRRTLFEKASITVNIDHHPTNPGFAALDYTDPSCAASAEIIYALLGEMGIDPGNDEATCLYTAIASDTGGFRYSNTTPATHIIASELLIKGIDVADISRRIFDTVSPGKVRLAGEAINSLKLYEDGRIAVIYIPNEAMRRSGAADEDTDGIINIARNINGVEAAAMLREMENGDIRVNLRSNSHVDVSAIASKYSGGGHTRAAGFTVRIGDLEQVGKMLLDDLRGLL
ncbi:MAG: bifunctional oligoribonuclease/PAP phosphatase NrnA [Clostridiaceae bacterium]|nr:bifunctional oligoribonuclease/PAP phosphatase NrnA [Clostridiaceae bacterium]